MDKKNIINGVTGFIDILGFSERVINAESYEDIELINNQINFIQSKFEATNNSEETKELQEIYQKTVLAFSDCVIINIGLQSQAIEYSGDFDPIMCQLHDIALAQAECAQKSIFLRGGIDMGWWYQQGSTMISEGLVNAVKRETSAEIPVIALCDKIYHYFSNHQGRSHYHPHIEPIQHLLKEYKSENTNFFYLDYISTILDTLISFDGSPQDWLKEHAEAIKKASKTANNKAVMDKYYWLAKYHNEIANEYQMNKNCFCNI